MGQGESRISDSQKLLIKKAIWIVFEIRSCLSYPDEYEKQLCDYLQRKFPLNDCVRHRLVGSYMPDIVIKDVGVIEVKNMRWANIDSTRKGRIETYMKLLSMPGLMVNFPHSGFPYIRWYYLDENKEPKLECIETLDSDPSEPTSASQASSNSNTRCSEESRFSDSQKLSIKKAIWLVYQLGPFSSNEYEMELRNYLHDKFPSNDCVLHFHVEMPYKPDILIKNVGIIEVKHGRWTNIDSTRRGRIETYMEKLSVPGLMVNFPHSGFPYLRWHYLDENKEAKIECYETLDSDPTFASEASNRNFWLPNVIGSVFDLALGAAVSLFEK